MAVPDNVLQQVITYNDSNLAKLLNQMCWLNVANMHFKHFNDSMPANLGSTVSFDIPTRMTTTGSLVANFQAAIQRVQNLTVDRPISVSYAFTAEQYMFNVKDYMTKFGESAIAEMASAIEHDIAEVAEKYTYRFYGDGVTNISTSLQLAKMLAQFRTFGAAKNDTVGILDDLSFPQIVNSNLSQFAPTRNDREAYSWEVGSFSNCDWYQSNLLKVHESGTVGNEGITLTVVSVVQDDNGAVVQITFSGAPTSDADAIKKYDKGMFADGVTDRNNLRFLTYYGHVISAAPVQFRVEADAESDNTGQVTANVYPPLKASAGAFQNINTEIVAGMQATFLPSHKCGLVMAGRPLYVAMPRMPSTQPYPSSTATDPDTGASIRMYYGWIFGQNTMGNVHDAIWGKTLVDDWAMMVAIPIY